MSKFKCIFFAMCATMICTISSAQVNDSIPVKTSIFSKLNFTKIHLPKFNFYKKDTSNSKSNELKEKKAVSIAAEKVKDTAKKASFLTKLGFNKSQKLRADSTIVVAPIAPVAEKVNDTTKKASFLTKLGFNKSQKLRADSAIVIAPVAQKVKDTAKKASFLTKLGFNKSQKLRADSTIVVAPIAPVAEKVNDTTKKASFLTKLGFNKSQKLRADSAIVIAPVAQKVKDTSSIYKSIKEKLLKYTATTTVSLLAGANFSKQIINAGDFNSNFNYIYSDINNDVYKTGYFGGIRLDGMFKKKHEYSLGLSFSKFSSGTSYKSSTSLRPVIGSFSNFKAEDNFFAMNIVAHYKKLIPFGDLDKFKFYIVGGPSIDARLSNTSLDNKVTNAYKQIFFKGDLGFEFNNRSLYTLFFHYQHNIGSITKAPIKTNINTFQIGIMVKAADLL